MSQLWNSSFLYTRNLSVICSGSITSGLKNKKEKQKNNCFLRGLEESLLTKAQGRGLRTKTHLEQPNNAASTHIERGVEH